MRLCQKHCQYICPSAPHRTFSAHHLEQCTRTDKDSRAYSQCGALRSPPQQFPLFQSQGSGGRPSDSLPSHCCRMRQQSAESEHMEKYSDCTKEYAEKCSPEALYEVQSCGRERNHRMSAWWKNRSSFVSYCRPHWFKKMFKINECGAAFR